MYHRYHQGYCQWNKKLAPQNTHPPPLLFLQCILYTYTAIEIWAVLHILIFVLEL